MSETPIPPPPGRPPPPALPPRASAADGLRFAFGTLTALPVRVDRWDRAAARAGMAAAPLAGLVLALAAAALAWPLLRLGAGPLLVAVVSVAVPAALTRGLHLDGLADTADGLGSGRPPEGALAVMKRSDIGPFGVVTLVLTLLAQVAAVAQLYAGGWVAGATGTAVAALTGRLALTLASRPSVPPARPEGLGAAVAGTVPAGAAVAVAGAVLAAAVLSGLPDGVLGAVRAGLAVAVGLAAAEVLLRHTVRRFGGVTGDVFGALEETALTAALLVLTFG
ncbi:adenosylcobinamide-GDP ribazoletransferase [Streptomyces sp. NPDC058374]|uniref:adenosylcobinamide-GDP ribazoletransferase n=1 Tax=unclassified Streptomyces TaxID=2593676 RepID=UPI00364F8732